MFERMLRAVRKVPRGKVATYGQIAEASGFPKCARQVVWAMRSGRAVPWHRIVGAGGVIRLTGEPGFEQRLRLRTEGVVIAGNKIDLARYGHKFIN